MGEAEEKFGVWVGSKSLSLDQFWDLVERSLKRTLAGDQPNGFEDAYRSTLDDELIKLPVRDIMEFAFLDFRLSRRLHTGNLQGVCWMINEVGHDDTFEDFKSWLVYMGREIYETAVRSPDDLVDHIDSWGATIDCGPGAWSLIENLHAEGEISDAQFRWYESEIEDIRENCAPPDEDDWEKRSQLPGLFPRLAKYTIARGGPRAFED